MKLNKLVTAFITAGIISTTTHANCMMDSSSTGWNGSITFHCDSETNLKDNPIQFDIDNGIELSSAWGLDANPQLEQNGNHITVTTTNWYPADTARMAQPNQSLTLSFSATNGMISKIENFKVGSNTPKYQGSINIELPTKPNFIHDNTLADVVVFKKLIDGYAKVGEFNQSPWGETIHLSVNLNSPSQGFYVMVKSLNGHTGSATPQSFRLQTGKMQTVAISYASAPEAQGNLEINASVSGNMPTTQPAYTITNAQGNVVKQGDLSFSTATMVEGLLTTQGDDQYTLQLNRFNEGDFEYIPQLETQHFTITENQTTRINASYTQHAVQPQQMRFNISDLPQGSTSTLTLSHSQGESNTRTLEIDHNGAYTLEIPQDGKAWQINASSIKGYKAVVTPANFIADGNTTSITVKYEEVQQAQEHLMPFKDMTFNMIWNTTPIHSNIQEIADKSGNYSYVMEFVTQNAWSQTCFPAWGGAPSLALYDDLYAQDTQYLQSKGGSVAVSFGGENGASVESACSVDEIKNAYQYVLNTYKPVFIDFDIEGGAVADQNANTKRFEAIKEMQQAGIDLKVSLTLPANTAGFPPQVLDLIKQAKNMGVELYEINAMTMAWYSQKLPNRPIADSVMASADVITTQLQAIYPDKTTQEIRAMLRVTPKIGIDYDMSVFYPSDAQSLSQYVMANGLAGVGFWSADIDRNKNINGNCGVKSADPDCSGVDQRPYEFTQTFAQYLNLNQ